MQPFVSIYHEQGVPQGQFLSEVNWFKSRVFLLLDWLPNKDKETILS